jgi:hypothetical protein
MLDVHDQIWKRHSDQLLSIAPSQAADSHTGLESTEFNHSTDRDSDEIMLHNPDVPTAPEVVTGDTAPEIAPNNPDPNPSLAVPPVNVSETSPPTSSNSCLPKSYTS